jgi:hypothetical protein
MRESVGVWNNANTWIIIERYLHVAVLVNRRCVRGGARGPCLVCCGQDRRQSCVQYTLVCGFLVTRMLLLTAVFWKTTCYTVMVLYCTRVHQLDVYCHSTVLLLFWILSYLRVKENVIVWLFLCGRFRIKLRGSVWVGFLRQFQILWWASRT